MSGRRVRQNPGVGPAGHRDVPEPVGDGEQILERTRHGALAGAASEHKRAVDVEEEDGHGTERSRYPSPRTLPARGPFADGSSSKLTRWPSFN